MPDRPPDTRRRDPVRLTEIPLERRRRAGAALLRAAQDGGDLESWLSLRLAIEHPSPRVYWIAR